MQTNKKKNLMSHQEQGKASHRYLVFLSRKIQCIECKENVVEVR